jgi:hypothetical protein
MAPGVAMESPHKWLGLPAPKAHLALLILSFAPIVLPIPTNANIIITAALCVYIGAWRSVKSAPPSEHMSQRVRYCLPLKAYCPWLDAVVFFSSHKACIVVGAPGFLRSLNWVLSRVDRPSIVAATLRVTATNAFEQTSLKLS